ncbi:MAG: nicotinate phosphoribosyltransferase [Nitriliruptoraceae bacterium]
MKVPSASHTDHSPTLLTDRYEYTMVDAALADGSATRPCVFEVFTRSLPAGRRYGVIAGLERLIDHIVAFQPHADELAWLDDEQVVSPATLDWLATMRFSGDVVAFREGEIHTAGEPVLTVIGPFAETVLLETLVLSVLNYDCAIAAAAARMVTAAHGRTLLDFGSRRSHEMAAIAAARAAWITGFDGTSNLAAGQRYGIPTTGTAAHAFMLVHDDEAAAFASQVKAAHDPTTLLVDTFDTTTGVAHAIEAAHASGRVAAIRIDSGDLADEAQQARQRLDAAGLGDVRIVVSGDLDEYRIADLAHAPIDGYGVGTSLVTGSGSPTAGFVYKLVARARYPGGQMEPVAKGGGVKATVGGHKRVRRHLIAGLAKTDLIDPWPQDHGGAKPARRPLGGGETRADQPAGTDDVRDLQVTVIKSGQVVSRPSLDEIRSHHLAAMSELDDEACRLDPGPTALTTSRDNKA